MVCIHAKKKRTNAGVLVKQLRKPALSNIPSYRQIKARTSHSCKVRAHSSPYIRGGPGGGGFSSLKPTFTTPTSTPTMRATRKTSTAQRTAARMPSFCFLRLRALATGPRPAALLPYAGMPPVMLCTYVRGLPPSSGVWCGGTGGVSAMWAAAGAGAGACVGAGFA
ncbi:hypothetical protein C8035_v009593 [Colletotrichum spinosum]|uniref:Uncharacterized protein n=1 Tax=Colletotrichum spinosum TaxID=1347390 RepID=A0A4R8QDV4_9PEZI|nr:hypothetical protein C8035_v009593 [Colletotrichum spinosum]